MKGSKSRDKTYSKTDAVRYAYRLLSYRGRSEKELEDRFREKDFPEEIIQSAITHLKEKGFINDKILAFSLKRTAEDIKLLGRQGIRLFLKSRGLGAEIIKDVTSDNDPDELKRAKKLVDRKTRTMRNYSDEEIKKKIWRFLARKGYSFDTIKKVLNEYKYKTEEE
ncbi:MAG: recombination regulator RecX [Nitrospiraceae bacterium]|nr:recombination regulator RecX [Nitrospiraceae bacterium]